MISVEIDHLAFLYLGTTRNMKRYSSSEQTWISFFLSYKSKIYIRFVNISDLWWRIEYHLFNLTPLHPWSPFHGSPRLWEEIRVDDLKLFVSTIRYPPRHGNKKDLVTQLCKISSNLRCYICVIVFQYGPKEVPENKSASIGLLEVGKHLLDLFYRCLNLKHHKDKMTQRRLLWGNTPCYCCSQTLWWRGQGAVPAPLLACCGCVSLSRTQLCPGVNYHLWLRLGNSAYKIFTVKHGNDWNVSTNL